MKIRLFVLHISIIFLFFTILNCKNSSPTAPEPTPEPEPTNQQGTKLGDTAVNFTAIDQNGNNVSLYDYSGKVVLVNISADWCGPCRDEATHLESLYDEYKNRGFQIITALISGDPSDWTKEYGITFPVLDDNDEDIWDQYGEGSIPLNLVIDRDKVIRYKKAGYSEAAIKAVIENYL